MTNMEKASMITDAVNGSPSSIEGIVDALTFEHKTLQQNFTRLCFAWIERVATDPNYRTDDRNRATQVKCKAIYEAVKNDLAWNFLPFI